MTIYCTVIKTGLNRRQMGAMGDIFLKPTRLTARQTRLGVTCPTRMDCPGKKAAADFTVLKKEKKKNECVFNGFLVSGLAHVSRGSR